MRIRYDKEADALYISLREGSFARNRKVDDATILDLDEEGNILGIEFLDASRRIESLPYVRLENLKMA